MVFKVNVCFISRAKVGLLVMRSLETGGTSGMQSYLTAVQTTFRERYEEHARTVKRVKVASTVVDRSALPLAPNGTQERLLQPVPRVVVGESGLGIFRNRWGRYGVMTVSLTSGGDTSSFRRVVTPWGFCRRAFLPATLSRSRGHIRQQGSCGGLCG